MPRKLSRSRSRNHSRVSALNYAALEPRQLLAGDVQVSFRGGTLIVTGDSAANQITIVGTDSGLSVTGQNTLINGATTPFNVSGAIRNVNIQMRDGDDTATVRNVTVGRDFEIHGDNGADQLRLFHVFSRRFEAFLGSGDDTLELEDIRTDREFRVLMGAGNDSVGLKHLIAGRNAIVVGGEGNDLFAADELFAIKKFNLDLGSGDDQAIFAGRMDVYRSSNFDLGAGDDLLAVVPAESNTTSVLRGRAKINGSGGNDRIVADTGLTLERTSKLKGGGGDDAMHFLGANPDLLFNKTRRNGFQSLEVPGFRTALNSAFSSLSARGLDPFDRDTTSNPQASLLEFDPATQYVTVNDTTPTPSARWDQAIQSAVLTARSGPTIASRAYSMVHTAMYDAWSAYDPVAVSTTRGDELQRPATENTDANKLEAMCYAALEICNDLFPEQSATFTNLMNTLGFDPGHRANDSTSPAGVGQTLARALLDVRHNDGSNQLGTSVNGTSGVRYSDPTNYVPVNPVGDSIDIEKWTPERVPIDAAPDVPMHDQHFLTPHWGTVTPFAITSMDSIRPAAPQPFLLVEGTVDLSTKTITLADNSVVDITPEIVGTIINPGFIDQSQEVVTFSSTLTDRQKLIAEFWEDGGGTAFPPGTWMTFGQYVSARDNHSLDDDAKMFFSLSNAVFDAGVATWEAKRFYDYTRPVRAIRELGELGLIGEFDSTLGGNAITAYLPGSGVQKILASQFMTYQTPGSDSSPPFSEYTSGHSAFSASAAEILKRFTGSDSFGAKVDFAIGQSRFQPGITPAAPVTLSWDTFSAAADEAGVSRLYGGIHFTEGDVNSRILGRSVGELVWNRANQFINGTV